MQNKQLWWQSASLAVKATRWCAVNGDYFGPSRWVNCMSSLGKGLKAAASYSLAGQHPHAIRGGCLSLVSSIHWSCPLNQMCFL